MRAYQESDKIISGSVMIETIINLLTNGSLNALCAWLIFRNADYVDVSFFSVCIDIYITVNCTVMFTTLFASAAAKRYFRKGQFKLLSPDKSLLSQFPVIPVFLAIFIAAIFALILMPVLAGIFSLVGVAVLPQTSYIIYKGIVGGLVGATTCNLVLRRYLISQRYANG